MAVGPAELEASFKGVMLAVSDHSRLNKLRVNAITVLFFKCGEG